MMQGVLQHLLGANFLVESAGLSRELAGRPANRRSVACMKARGIDLSRYRWIVCVGPEEAAQVHLAPGGDPVDVMIAHEQGGGIPDPYELGEAGYRDCLALLDQVMPEVARRIQ